MLKRDIDALHAAAILKTTVILLKVLDLTLIHSLISELL